MSFRISALPASRFAHLFGQNDEALRAEGVLAKLADGPGYPCRVTLRDADAGERLLLLNYEHQSAPTPFRSAHAIYVIDGAKECEPAQGEIPAQLRSRLLSVRAFSEDGMMLDAEVVEGRDADGLFERMLANRQAAYLHAHFARFGCYAARVDRA